MPRFLSNLILDPLSGRKWRVVCPLVYSSDIAGILTVPAEFVCDLNSIPRFLWWASTPTDFPEAGVLHDWSYRGNLPRDVADKVYQEALRALGMSSFRAQLRYRSLRVFGARAYNVR